MLKALSVFVCLLMSTKAYAESTTYLCELTKRDAWIADRVFFEYDPDREVVRVIDGIIVQFDKKAKVATISENSEKKLAFTWRVSTRNRSQTTNMTYRLAFFKLNGKALVQAKPHGFTNNYTGRGTCKKINQPLPTS